MSRAILTGKRSQQVGPGPVQIEIANSESNSGITIVGNTFSAADLGDYYINASLAVDAIGGVRSYVFELYNETLGASVQAWRMDAETAGIGDSQMFLFSFTVTNVAHLYSMRVFPTGGGLAPRMNFVLTRVLISSFAVTSPISGSGTQNVVAKFTSPSTIGDSSITDNGTTVTSSVPFTISSGSSTALYFESTNGETAPVSGVATGRIRYNNTAGAFQISVQGGAYANIATGTGLIGTTQSASPFLTALGVGGANSATGIDNTAVGYHALNSMSTGSDNVAVGYSAAATASTATNLVAIGSNAGFTNDSNTGSGCVFIGNQAGFFSTGISNTFVGGGSGTIVSSGAQLTFIGASTGVTATTGSNNVLIGYNANVSANNTASAVAIGRSARVAVNGVTIGDSAGALITGTDNIVIGKSAGDSFTTGINNVCIGTDAGGAAGATAMSDNVFLGYQAGLLATANGNVFIGSGAGDGVVSGLGNVFIGKDAGGAAGATTQGSNTFIGSSAGLTNAASNNTFVGADCGKLNSGGNTNTAVGNSALTNNASGSFNTAVGYNCFAGALTGGNTGVGYNVGSSISSGTQNTLVGFSAGAAAGAASVSDTAFFGYNAGVANTANQNTFLGSNAGKANTTGTGQCFAGYNAGLLVTGSDNTIFGMSAGDSFTTGARNTLMGKDAGGAAGATAMSDCTFLGYQAGLVNTGNTNTFIGSSAGKANTSNTGQVFIGYNAGQAATGSDNTIVGYQAGDGFTTGTQNTIIGSNAGGAAGATTMTDCCLVGFNSGLVNTTNRVTAIGSGALASKSSGNFHTAVGYFAGHAISTSDNSTMIGYQAGYQVTEAGNCFIGEQVGATTTDGAQNTLLGILSDTKASSTNNAVAVGYSAKAAVNGVTVGSSSGTNITGTGNIVVGFSAGTVLTSGTNNILIGNGSQAESTGTSNTCVIGGATSAITNVFFNKGITSTAATACTMHGTGGSGSDNAGADILIAGGFGTGIAANGYVGVTYGLLTTTGSTLHTVSTLKNYYCGIIYTSTVDATLVANGGSTTGTLIGAQTSARPQGTLTLDANILDIGSTIEIKSRGRITQSAAGPTFTIDIKLGATVVATAIIPVNAGGITDGIVDIDVTLTCRTTGGSGTVQGSGMLVVNTTAGTVSDAISFYKAVTTVDTTISKAIDVFGTWAANTAGNSATFTNTVIKYR